MIKIKDYELIESDVTFILTGRDKPMSIKDRRRFQDIYFHIYKIRPCLTCPGSFNFYYNNLYNQIKHLKDGE